MIADFEFTALAEVALRRDDTEAVAVEAEIAPARVAQAEADRASGETCRAVSVLPEEDLGGASHYETGASASNRADGPDREAGLNTKAAAHDFAQAAGMRPAGIKTVGAGASVFVVGDRSEENSGGLTVPEEGGTGVAGEAGASSPAVLDVTHGTNGACADKTLKSEARNTKPKRTALEAEEWRVKEANRRRQVLETWRALLQQGYSRAKAAKKVGQGYVTIYRWEKAEREKGFNGLLPDTGLCGRMTTWEKLGLKREQFEAIMKEVRGINLDTKSVTAALRLYANSDRCPTELAAVILDPNRCSKHALPPSLRNGARVNRALGLAHQGPRALALGGIWTPRKVDILPGDIFTADDTTPIWAWWVPWERSEQYPFGVKVLQGQFIPVLDVASQACVCWVLIAREKSSYRASDIWHLFGHTFDEVGLPRLGWQLERGSWEANIIRGQEVEYREGEATMTRRLGGLRQLPTQVTSWHRERLQGAEFPKTLQTWTSYLPKSKSIEGWFNRNQTFEQCLWGCLGRDQMRAPNEKAKQRFNECARGARDPREHFLSGTEIGARINEIVRYINNEPMEGEVFRGVPMQIFEAAVAERPLYRPEPEWQWLWRRNWTVTAITQGWARVRLTDELSGERYSLFYTNPEVFAGQEGEEVAVYYDREDFEKPAQILGRNGEYLCSANYFERKGSFLTGDQSGHDIRKRWKNAVLSIYGTLARHSPSRQVPEEIERRRQGKSEIRNPKSETNKSEARNLEPRMTAAVPAPANGSRAAGPTPEQLEKQRNRITRQAEIAARLRGLRGEE